MSGSHECLIPNSAPDANDTVSCLAETTILKLVQSQHIAAEIIADLIDRTRALERRCVWLESQLKPFYNEWGSMEDAERTHFLLHRYFDDNVQREIPTLAKCPVHRTFYEGRKRRQQQQSDGVAL